jgi:transcriptional regulator with XRE-family HTH domain
MQTTVTSPEELGLLVRAVRRSSQVRIDDLAAMARVSKQFATDVELGKPTVRLGLVFQILNELGLKVSVEVPASAQKQLVTLRSHRVRRLPNKPSAAAISAEATLTPDRPGHQGPAAGGGKKD